MRTAACVSTGGTPVPLDEQLDPELPLSGRANQPQPSQLLELSQSRTYDAAVTVLRAYKLTGNFPAEFEIVLRDLRVLDQVTYDIEPKSPLSDIRRVVFRAKTNIDAERFREIVLRIGARIGSRAATPWWAGLFR
jgi:hypothetical protein